MAKAKKKTAKKATRKAGKTKTVKGKAGKAKAVKTKTIGKRKPGAAPRGKSAKKIVKKSKSKKIAPRRAAADDVRLGVSYELDTRLRELAIAMNKSLEEVLIQALTEFADNWEDHMNTVNVLGAEDDRVQLVAATDDDTD